MEQVTALLPGVRRFVAPNPSMMTGPGTNTYLFGERELAVLDPGPVIAAHLEHIQRDAGGTIRWILVTHTHPDHSPGARVLAEMTGAELIGRPAPEGQHQDDTFVPDRILGDGDALATEEFILEAVHTPGHASNHLCYRHVASNWLFTGDHVIDGSTVVINPPDGNMKQYIESLRRVLELGVDAIVPGHGEVVKDPERLVNWTIDHRLEREDKVFAALQANQGLAPGDLVPHVYQDVPEHLYRLAERSLLAHLIKLEEDGRVQSNGNRWRTGD